MAEVKNWDENNWKKNAFEEIDRPIYKINRPEEIFWTLVFQAKTRFMMRMQQKYRYRVIKSDHKILFLNNFNYYFGSYQ